MEQKQKKLPERQCLGCNEHKPKRELMRVVRTPGGEVILDRTGKQNGRGAYICQDAECFRRARKSKRIEHALDCSIPDDVWERMERQISEVESK